MYKWSPRMHLKRGLHFFQVAKAATSGKRYLSLIGAMVLLPMLLTGCVDHAVSNNQTLSSDVVIPDTTVVDFNIASCDTLWSVDSKEDLENSLYWLRAMDCADRLSTGQARQLANEISVESWDSAFKQSILLASAEPTAPERRRLLDKVNSYRAQMPGSLRPLVQLWRERQNLHITLINEREKSQHMQDTSESQLSAMREEQLRLQEKLDDTQRKLENLTDIERQLSSRKQMQGDMSESSSELRSRAESSATDAGKSTTKSKSRNANSVEPDDTYVPPASELKDTSASKQESSSR